MTVKLYAVIALVFIASLMAVQFALAQETVSDLEVSDNLEGDPGATPDSAGYGLKLGWEKIGLWFTFKQEKKAGRELVLARKRLLEVRRMAEKGNLKAMLKAQEKHDELVASAQERLARLGEDSTEARVKLAVRKVIGLEVAIKAHENRIEVLKDILAEKNLSDEARTAIEAAVARMENRTAIMEQKLEERKDKFKTRLRAVTEKNESEVESEVKELESEAGLVEAEKAIAEKRIEKAEEALAKLKERVAEEKLKEVNVSAVETHIAEAEAKIAEAKAFVAEGKYAEAIAILKPVSNYGRNLSVVVRKIKQVREENKKEEIKNLLEKAKEIREQRIEQLKEVSKTREEIKTAIKEKISESKSKSTEE